MLSSKQHVARWRRERTDDPDINAFVAWLVAEAAATIANTKELIREQRLAGESGAASTLRSIASVTT